MLLEPWLAGGARATGREISGRSGVAMQWVSSWGCFEHDRSLRWRNLYFSKFLAVAFTGAELSVVSVGDKDEDGTVFAGDLDRLAGGGAQVEQIDAQRVRSFSALVRMAEDRTPFTARQDEFSCERLEECGLKPGGWPKQAARAKDAKGAKVKGKKHDEMPRVVVGWAFGLYKELDDQGTDQ